jgi:hypothetical protein
MKLAASSATWICMVLVAMPMTPCALLPRVCVLAYPATATDADEQAVGQDAPAAHSCCREAQPGCTAGDDVQTHHPPAKPCPRGCCRLLPVGPTVDKVVVTLPPLVAAYVPTLADGASQWIFAPAQEPLLPAETLHSLSCLWRC